MKKQIDPRKVLKALRKKLVKKSELAKRAAVKRGVK